ncbi:MAG: hypothetical protein GY711_10890, partial [bacterium]|nr:hypothetical protein [bacterium]
MMAGFREWLPIFSGDNIFYFMQKGHYFLHLSRDVTPDAFAARCAKRTAARAARGADPDLGVREGFTAIPLEYAYRDVLATLGHPLARAARPDFLTGRFVADAQETAEARLPAARGADRVLVYDGENCEFVELRPDGLRALEALRRAGSLAALAETIDSSRPNADRAREKLMAFAAELHRLGVLAPRGATVTQPV